MGNGRIVVAGWRIVNQTVPGTSHERSGLPCQDFSLCAEVLPPEGPSILAAVASDGAGTAVEAAAGARIACETMLSVAGDLIGEGRLNPPSSTSLVEKWLAAFREQIDRAADEKDLKPRDFACTFLAAIIASGGAMFVQVGDGAIVVREHQGEEYDWVFWPQNGEYANTTFFATDPLAEQHIELEVVRRAIDEVALFTDGMQPLVLNYAARTAHDPFFRRMFSGLRSMEPLDQAKLDGSLRDYLDSHVVNERTDDDKTLVLAARSAASQPPAC